jgi:hypothetical protein
MMPANTSAKLGEKLRDANRSQKSIKDEMNVETETFLRHYFEPYNKELNLLSGFDTTLWEKKK